MQGQRYIHLIHPWWWPLRMPLSRQQRRRTCEHILPPRSMSPLRSPYYSARVLPAGFTDAMQFQITKAHQIFHRNLAPFNTCNLSELTTLQQISTAIDEDCLANLNHEDTGLLEGTVLEMFQELFDNYRAITPQSLTATKVELEATQYNHAKPILTVFTAIDEHGSSMAEAATVSERDSQLINIGMMIIVSRATSIFTGNVHKWHDTPQASKTWPNFKAHFKEARTP